MTIKLGTATRNQMLNTLESSSFGGAGTVLRVLSGTAPANAAAAQTGTLLAEIILPTGNWMSDPVNGSAGMSGGWVDLAANNSGTATYFRIIRLDNPSVETVVMQGDVTATGGGGDMTLTTTAITAGQSFTVTSFTINMGNP